MKPSSEASGNGPLPVRQHYQICATASSGAPYIIAGKKGNGDVCLNGPPAHHHFKPGDLIIVLSEVDVEPE